VTQSIQPAFTLHRDGWPAGTFVKSGQGRFIKRGHLRPGNVSINVRPSIKRISARRVQAEPAMR